MAPPREPRRRRSFWYRPGLDPRQSRILDVVLVLLVVGFVAAWIYGLSLEGAEGGAPRLGERLTASPLSPDGPPEAAFLLDAAVRRFATANVGLRGRSGALRVLVPEPGERLPVPGSLPDEVEVELRRIPTGGADTGTIRLPEGEAPVPSPEVEGGAAGGEPTTEGPRPGAPAPEEPGQWGFLLRRGAVAQWVPGFRILNPVPISRKREGRIGGYLIGNWPFELGGTPPSSEYGTPRGMVEVTPENVDLPISDHFVLGDFLTKGQEDVWPKYVVLSTRVLDKVELVIQELERMGHPVENVGVISAFRTPQYNVGGGDPSGRGALSRHMFGDAIDFYIDNDGDGRMDDLDGDGQVGIGDARVIAEAVERVERAHPDLIGGLGVYRPTGAHAGFVHVDTRGSRARW